jgi:hypothetical protein
VPVDLSKFSREELILAVVAILLAFDLLFLPWFEVSIGLGSSLELSASSPGTGAPDGWLGVLGVLASLVLVADLALERLSNANLPAIGGTRGATRLAMAIFAAACVALKFILNVHFSLFGFGFWAAVVLAVAVVVMARRARDAERASGPGRPPS